MTVPTKLADVYRQEIENEILNRDNSIETQFGPIRDVVIRPAATVFEDQNADIRAVENLQTFADPASIELVDLNNVAFENWQIRRLPGSRSTGSVVFRTSVRPLSDITVPSGFPVATVRDDTANFQVQFITTEVATLVAASADLFFNASTGFYELEVPIRAVNTGAEGQVATNRVTVLLRPISGFSSVTNPSGSDGGADQESNISVVERLQIARQGIDISTVNGVISFVRQNFPDVVDIVAVFGDDPLLTRASEDSGAADYYIKGFVTAPRTDNYLFDGSDHIFNNQPVLSIVSVTDTITTFVQGVDYQLTKDTGGNAGSVRAVDKLEFLGGGASPAIGATVTAQYNVDSLIISLQTVFGLETNKVLGRDLLFKQGVQTEVRATSDLTVLSGFSPATVQGNVRTAIKNFINALDLGENVEIFDVITAVVNTVQGVDNLVFTLFDFVGGGGGVQDLTIEKNQFANLLDANLIVNIV